MVRAYWSEVLSVPFYQVEQTHEYFTDAWNASCDLFRAIRPDAVIVLGSDDVVTVDYLHKVGQMIAGGCHYVVPRDIHYYEVSTGRLVYATHDRLGAGRVISRKRLEERDWKPWAPGKMNNDRALHFEDAKYIDHTDMLDIKTDDNVCTMNKSLSWARSCKEVDPSWLKEKYPALELGANL